MRDRSLPGSRCEHYKHELDHGTSVAKYEMSVLETVKEAKGDALCAELPGHERR